MSSLPLMSSVVEDGMVGKWMRDWIVILKMDKGKQAR
jgi:hypothetical protein